MSYQFSEIDLLFKFGGSSRSRNPVEAMKERWKPRSLQPTANWGSFGEILKARIKDLQNVETTSYAEVISQNCMALTSERRSKRLFAASTIAGINSTEVNRGERD